MTKHLFTSALITSFILLTACGESGTEPLPDGTAPTDPPRTEVTPPEEPADDDTSPEPDTPDVADEPTDEPTGDLPPLPPLPQPVDDAERLSAPGLTYVLPEGWTVGPERQMRLLTLLPPNGGGADLAISKWPRDVGGFVLNVNRWTGQVGLPPIEGLMTAESSDFEKFKIDGHTATWIPLMNEDTGRAILAVWLPIGAEPENPDNTWTFKLTCSADQIQQLAPAVRAFCESIKFE